MKKLINLQELLKEAIEMSIHPKSIATVNKMLKSKGIKERLVKGNGYYYFIGGDADSWYSSSVSVYRVNELTLQQWLDEIDNLRHYKR